VLEEAEQGPPEHARGAGEDEGAHSCRRRFLEQIERTCDIRVDEVLTGVRGDVWFVQRRRVQHGMHSPHASVHEATIRDRPDLVGEGRFLDVNAN
jgi:hypothetical protein